MNGGSLRCVLAIDGERADRLARDLRAMGHEVTVRAPHDPDREAAHVSAQHDASAAPDVLVILARPDTLTRAVIAACDREGVRVLPWGDDDEARRLAQAFGLARPVRADASAYDLIDALSDPVASVRATPRGNRVIAVWGAHGAPGRSTLAIELAAHLAASGRGVALVDADSHAPSLALSLGLPDEGPGFAAACRQAHRGALDEAELDRIALSVGPMKVLAGINRPSRWPELPDGRVRAALARCRGWVQDTVVDVAAPLEADEEIVSDLEGNRRNAATLAAVREADVVVAVVGADPVGVARFLRGYAQLRQTVGDTPIVVVANRLRPGALGVDARGQVRRTLDRFAGIRDTWFVPHDPRSADAALLAASPIAHTAPRSPIVAAVRRICDEALVLQQARAA